MTLQVVYEDRSVRFGTFGHAIVTAWVDPPNRARAIALRKLQDDMAKHEFVAMLHVVNAAKGSPLSLSDEDRREMTAALSSFKGANAAAALTFEGPPFFVASWRSILSAALLFARPKFPTKVFSGRMNGANWLETQQPKELRGRLTAAELLDIAAKLERGLTV